MGSLSQLEYVHMFQIFVYSSVIMCLNACLFNKYFISNPLFYTLRSQLLEYLNNIKKHICNEYRCYW